MKNEIIIFKNQKTKLEVNIKDETVWLTLNQIAELFNKDKSVISRHLKNIYLDKELEKSLTVAKNATIQNEGNRKVERNLEFYNLDAIISVGYRVNSKQATEFRKWATNVLKQYMLKGVAINEERLKYLEKTVKLIDIANRANDRLENKEAKEILKVIGNYSKALDLLDKYDHKVIKKPKGTITQEEITYEDCIRIIKQLKYNEKSDIFALERNEGLKGIIGNIYQTFAGDDVYPSIEEKAANFLYLVIKNHVFIDGNKRIAATLFIYFLFYYDILYKKEKETIDNNTLTALTLLIAESNPKEKNIMIDLVTNFLD